MTHSDLPRKGRPPARFFIRDDDVGELTEALEGFVQAFVARALPVSYQVIPARLTAECAAYMLDMSRAHPGLIEFGQHGLHHRMVLGGRELKREFGPELSLAEQSERVAQGRALLAAKLGDNTPVEVFTPPQHKFDRNTVKAAAQAGHRIFSAAAYPTLLHQSAYSLGRTLGWSSIGCQGISYDGSVRPEADIVEISIAIDVDDGKIRKRNSAAVASSLRAPSGGRAYVGLMLHHALYGDRQGREDLAAIGDCLAAFGPERFSQLSSFARLDGGVLGA